MSRRHVALFAPSLRGGGAERIFATLANGFVRRGWRTDLVLARAEGPYLKEISPDVRVIDLGAGRVLAAFWPLMRYVRREKPEAILSTIASANAVALLVAALNPGRVKLILREANTPSVLVRHATSFRQRIIPGLLRLLKPHIRRIVAVSEGSADDLAGFYGVERSRIVVIANPVITADLADRAAQDPGHRWLGDAGLRVILAVGRLSKQKNYEMLLRSFASLSSPETTRLIVLGEGPERGALESLASSLGIDERVDLPGFVDNPFAYLANADVYVLSSDYEGLPATLIQALACGCTAVSTDCPSGPREILRDGEFGRLVPVGDVAALAEAVEAALADCADHSEHAGPPATGHLQRYEEEGAVDRYLRAIEEVIDGGPAAGAPEGSN